MHRKFAQNYIPLLQQAIVNYFKNAPDVEIRKVQKERFDKTLKNLEKLLKRVYTVSERYKIMEHFELNMNTVLFKSNYLQRRIDGLKGLNDLCKNVSKGFAHTISGEFLAEWLIKHNIVDELLGTRKHVQILQRSAQILGFLYEKHLLDTKILDSIWANTKDEQFAQDIFKVIKEIGFPLSSPELEYFAQKISSMSPTEISEDALEVIYEAHKTPNKTVEQVLKYSEMLAEIAFRKDYPLAVSEKSLSRYSELLSTLDFDPHKKNVLLRCVQNMQKNVNSVMAMKLIRRICNQYATTAIPGIAHTKGIIIDMLTKEVDLLHVFFDAYYKGMKENREVVAVDRYTHSVNINERVDFLNYLITNTTIQEKLSIKYIYKLWEMLCEAPVTINDSQIFFKFLKEMAADQAAYVKNFDAKEGKQFFDEKISDPKVNYENLTIEAFTCIVQFFNLINEHAELIIVTPINANKFTSYTSYSNVMGATYTEYTFTKKDENALPEVKVKVHPKNLNGIEIFWKIVQEANNKDVVEKARDFLSKLYTQLTGKIEDSASEIRGAFIETYLEKLAALISNKSPQRSEMIGKMVRLMMEMIDESERKGTGKLKSHNALLKGSLIDFVVINNVSSGKNVPKRMEVEVYSNTTIWELKAEIGKYLESGPDCMKINVGNKELNEADNGKSIGEFIQKRSGVITAEKKNMDDIRKAPLIDENQKMTEKAKKAFGEIFNKFAKDGKMDNEGAAMFIQNTTNEGNVSPDDGRIKQLFISFDKDSDGFLDAEGFCEFYRDAITGKREDTVRQNLFAHGFRNDLKKINEVEEAVIDITTLPRYILSCNPKSFDLLFHILDLGDASTEHAWNLISRLTTNETMYKSLLSLETAVDTTSGKLQWSKLIDIHSPYRLLYCLQIIESFLEDEAGANQTAEGMRRQEWRKRFIQYGGFEFLLSTLLNKDPSKGLCLDVKEKIGKLEKDCLGFIGNILNSFVKTATYTLKGELYKEMAKAQAAYKKRLTGVDPEDVPEEAYQSSVTEEKGTMKLTKRKDEDKIKEKSKETPFDLKELFKAKPSNILFLKSTQSEKKDDKKESGKEVILEEFKSSIDKTQAEAILALVNGQDFWQRQIEAISIVLDRSNIDNYDTKCVVSSVRLFSSCVFANDTVFNLAKTYSKDTITFDKLVVLGILCMRSQPIREEFMDMMYFMSYLLKVQPKEEQALEYILKILLNNTPKSNSPESKSCGEYFHLLCKLIDIYYQRMEDSKTEKREKTFDPKELLTSLVGTLRKHRSSEKRNSLAEDKLLIGIINTIRKVLSHEVELKETISINEGLMHELFFDCLFPTISVPSEAVLPTLGRSESQECTMTDAQKCKSRESRTAAYKLLATLCKGSFAGQSFLVRDCLEPLCKSIKKHNGWAYIPASESRSKLGYAGVENLGCICYMNAMIQQFYMIPAFRYSLLAADDKRPPAVKKPGEADDNVLHQLQRIFAFLELTERQDYHPGKFCFSFKDLDGKPTNTGIQQDAQEFLNLAFDRLENLLKITPEKYLLQNVFGGKTCSQLICKGGCNSVRKNYEDFYNLSLGVKGFKNLNETLTKFISGDTISEFFCENCKRKVDVVKRTCLHELPNVLIIHLQRIIYNYDSLTNEKINSRLEFPKEFSIEPYTVEGVEAREKPPTRENANADLYHGKGESYYQYRLAGVVIHVGMADCGHYYSYINTNRTRGPKDKEKDLFNSEKDAWLEYNDSHIRTFDPSKLEAECFGGSSESNTDSGWTSRLFDQNIKNAYMLVYERKEKTPIKRVVPKEEAERLLKPEEKALECENTALARVGQIYIDPKKSEYYMFSNFYEVKPNVPPNLYQEVWEDNGNFLFERQIYSLEFFKFVQDIFKESYTLLPTLPKETSAIIEGSIPRIATKIIYDVLAHAYYNNLLKPFTENLIQLFTRSDLAASEFLAFLLQDNLKETLFILTKCPDKDARVAVSRLVTEAILTLLPKEGTSYMEYEIEQLEKQQVFKYKTKIGQILHILISGINNDLASNWLRFEQYLSILYNVTKKGGENMALFMNDKRLVAMLIDFYLGKSSPLYEKGEKRESMGNKYKNPKFQPLIGLVCLLVSRADLTFMQPLYPKLHTLWKLPKVLYKLEEQEIKCVECKEFLMKTIVEGHATPEFAELLAIFCYESKKYSKLLARSLLKGINDDPTIDTIPFFAMLKKVLTIEDSLQKKRIEWLLGIGAPCKAIVQASSTALPFEQIKLGLPLIDGIRENISDYISPLNYNNKYESLLSLLWKHRKGFEINPIRCLLDLMTKSKCIFDYVANLPPPTYQFAKYPDWIQPLVINYPNTCRSFSGFATANTAEKSNNAYQDTVKLLAEYEKMWDKVAEKNSPYTDKQGVLLSFPQPYVIGKAVNEKKILTEIKEEVTLNFTEVYTEVYESFPNGKDNASIPESYFEKLKTEKYKGITLVIPGLPNQEIKETTFEVNGIKIKTVRFEDFKMPGKEEKKEEDKKVNEEIKQMAEEDKKTIQEETKKTQPAEPVLKLWKTEPTFLMVEVINNGTKTVKVKLDISEKKAEPGKTVVPPNFYVPSTSLIGCVEPQRVGILHIFQKKSLNAEWGDFNINWKCKQIEVASSKPKAEAESKEPDVYHYYMSDDEDEPYGKVIGPAGLRGQSGVLCPNCSTINPFNSEKCSRCSETLGDAYV